MNKKKKIKEKLSWLLDRYLGEKDYLNDKYRRIYGGGEYEGKIEKIRKENRGKLVICAAMITFIVLYTFLSENSSNFNVKEDKNGFAVEIQRDSKESAPVSMKVYGEKDGELFVRNVQIDAGTPNITQENTKGIEAEDDETMLNYRIDEAARMASSENGDIKLPSALSDGTRIYWKEERNTDIWIFPLLAALLFYGVYRQRFSEAEKEENKARESVVEELPGFISRISLLLQAGLVFNSAFEKIIADYEKRAWKKDSYFYGQLKRIRNDANASNLSVYKGIEDFARRSQIREFIRISNIITDNIEKGTELAEKLENESSAMWFSKKKGIEEKGRLAESKLIAPLMILLMILILITVAPAIMEM